MRLLNLLNLKLVLSYEDILYKCALNSPTFVDRVQATYDVKML